jgi:RNA recognition motif-containing protein
MSSVAKQSKKRTLEKAVEPKKKVQKTVKNEVAKKEVKSAPVKKVTKKEVKEESEEESETESEEESEEGSESEEIEKVELKDERTLFVGKIPTEVTEEDLKSLFGKYGTIEEIRFLWKNKAKKIHRGVAFIQFKSKSDSEAALVLDQKLVKGGKINVTSTKVTKKPSEGVVVFNASFDAIEDAVRSHFTKFGKIKNVFINKKILIKFETPESAIPKALSLNGTEFNGRTIKVIESNDDPTRKGKKRKTE